MSRAPTPLLLALVPTLALAGPLGAQGGRVSGRVEMDGAGVSHVVVSLHPLDGAAPGSPEEPRIIDQVHLRFVPGVVAVGPGDEVIFRNSDPLMHNVFGPGSRGGEVFDLGTYPLGESESRVFGKEGIHTVLCHIHPEMVAYVVVLDTPFKAVTSGEGDFVVRDVPPGRYRVVALNPARSRQEVTEEWIVGADGLEGGVLRFPTGRRYPPGDR